MTLIHNDERDVVSAVAGLLDCNPFLPERLALERRALGDAFVPVTNVWHADGDDATATPNALALRALVERLGTELRKRLAAGVRATPAELEDYERLVLYLLFQRYENDWYALIPKTRAQKRKRRKGAPPEEPQKAGEATAPPARVSCYERFARDVREFFEPFPGPRPDPAHLFALGFQARRAFHYIFRYIFGSSLPIALLRAAVWQSCFTDHISSYRAEGYAYMDDAATLIMGETGTGKELVASAIALSRYVPFDAETQTFAANPAADFRVVNLAGLSQALIEAELFGYCRGAFTGAERDHAGWFETCSEHGTIFLDEIGELNGDIQVKLLRVLNSGEFHRVGETAPTRYFAGKLIAATNRNLKQEKRTGRFRWDLYFRLCGDIIRTPTLREQLAAAPDDWHHLVRVVAAGMAGPKTRELLANKVEAWVNEHLPRDYAWPGNIRELEQCVHNIRLRTHYEADDDETAASAVMAPQITAPEASPSTIDDTDPLVVGVRNGTLSAKALLQGYCARVYAQTGNYRETARRIDLNWRTVATKVRQWRKRTGANADR